MHSGHPNYPFCKVGFYNTDAMMKHIETNHKESQTRPSVIKKTVRNQKPNSICIFNLQPRGCKKGESCEFSHKTGSQYQGISKVPKICGNGEGCSWKPGCRYVHPEDGESIPPRATRGGARESRAKICHWSARECPRGGPGSCSYVHQPEPINQGFLTPDVSQPPPGFSMTEFPVLPAPKRPSVFRQNPQYL